MKKLVRILAPVIGVFLLIVLDQWTKFLTITKLGNLGGASFTETFTTPLADVCGVKSVPIIDKVLTLTFVQNQGMAWGLFQNAQYIFVILTLIAVAVIVYHYIRAPWEAKFAQVRVIEVLIIGGAFGNLIDRVFRGGELFQGYVVDMIYVEAINFPVFNVADSAISIAFVWLIVAMLFVYKEEDFNRLTDVFPRKKSKSEESEEKDENN